MLYLLAGETEQAPWQAHYLQTYKKILRAEQLPFVTLTHADKRSLSYLQPNDILWIQHYADLEDTSVLTCRAKRMYRMSGTATHPYCYQVDMIREHKQLLNVIDINLSFHPRMSSYVRRFYPSITLWDTGYPVDVPSLPRKDLTKTILVGGRLSPDKNFMLSAYLLEPYLDGYNVVFCYPNSKGKDAAWLEHYGGKSRYERLGFKFEQLTRDGWLKRLQSAEFYFTASLGDTACSSCIEAVSIGVYPLVPRINDGLPCYDTYLNVGYEPFSQESLATLIKTKPAVCVDNTWFSPTLFGKRLKEYLDGTNP